MQRTDDTGRVMKHSQRRADIWQTFRGKPWILELVEEPLIISYKCMQWIGTPLSKAGEGGPRKGQG